MNYMKYKITATREHSSIYFEVTGDYTALCAVVAGMAQAGWKCNVQQTEYDVSI